MASTRMQFYRVQGTHYECAHQLGSLTRENIRRRIIDDSPCLEPLFHFISTEEGRQLHEEFIEITRERYPWYWDEIRGLADGSDVPLEKILVLNFFNETQTEYRCLTEQTSSTAEINETGEKGCTTVLLNRQDTNICSILHNEDHAKALLDIGYLLEAEIQSSEYDNGKRSSPREKFVAYCYPGSLPGTAFSVNSHGFALALNGLYPKNVARARLPRQIINRALLAVANQNDLDHLLRTSPTAFGFCINGAFINEKTSLFNYEIGPNFKVENENYLSKCFVINDDDKENLTDDQCEIVRNYLVHYNHYERLNGVIIEQKFLQSTLNRWKRGREFGEIFTVDEAMKLLGDEENLFYPIFRRTTEQDVGTATLCTVHFDFHSLKLLIYQDNPKDNNHPSLIYNLVDLFA